MIIDLLLRITHVLSAAILVGGAFFMRFSLAPMLAAQDESSRKQLLPLWRPGWARLVMITSGLLLISGLVNAVLMIKRNDFGGTPYHALVAVKLLVGMVVFWLSATLAGRTDNAEKFRGQLTMWLNLNLALVLVLVGVASTMKLLPHLPKEPVTVSQPSATP
ncbi:MAG: hypothetical protein KDA92_05065 [Planctomycetales bacterium]|nr:hypothetical protein [Planctomycetales bacterium]